MIADCTYEICEKKESTFKLVLAAWTGNGSLLVKIDPTDFGVPLTFPAALLALKILFGHTGSLCTLLQKGKCTIIDL